MMFRRTVLPPSSGRSEPHPEMLVTLSYHITTRRHNPQDYYLISEDVHFNYLAEAFFQ